MWDHAGLVWHGKRPKAGNRKTMENAMENGPQLDRGKNGQRNGPKMGEKWKTPSKTQFWAFFCPCPAGPSFPFGFPFCPISGSWPFSMPYQPGMIPSLDFPDKVPWQGGFSMASSVACSWLFMAFVLGIFLRVLSFGKVV